MPYRKTYEITLEFINEDELLQRIKDRTNFNVEVYDAVLDDWMDYNLPIEEI